MAYLARTETVANGIQVAFPVSFSYQSQAEVGIYVRETASFALGTKKVPGVDFNWTSGGVVTFVVAPLSGHTVVARRETLDTALNNTLSAGGSVKSSQLVANDRQLLYLINEREDADQDLQAQITDLDTTVADALDNPFIINGVPYDASAFPLPVLTPEMFGAKHTALIDDGPALKQMAAAINALGGGTVWMNPAQTYWVGGQALNGAMPGGLGTYTWAPTTAYSMEFTGCARGLKVMGNGARIKCLAGKKYGAFNENGTARADASPYFGAGVPTGLALSTPYLAMIYVHGTTGSVHIEDIELDGSIKDAAIGGPWGDVGIQIQMTGLSIENVGGQLTTINVNSHHQGLDGGTGNGYGLKSTRESVSIHGKFQNNGRQGFSLVGGNGWHFESCDFSGTGKDIAPLTASSPGAGVDLEAEAGKYVLDTTFNKCRFTDNTGAAMVADTNAFVQRATFRSCKFVGTTNWSLWAACEGFRFEDCVIVGAVVNLNGSDDISKTTQFIRCTLTDEAALSPTGTVYIPGGVLFSGGSDKIVLTDCLLRKTDNTNHSSNGNQGNLATGVGMRLHNCTVENISNKSLSVYGIYSGERTKLIDVSAVPVSATLAATLFVNAAGPSLDSFLYGHTINGFANPEARYNATADRSTGKNLYYGSAVWDPANVAAGASVTQALSVPGAVVGDKVRNITFSLSLAGLILTGYVSAADTVTAVLFNPTGGAVNLASGTLTATVLQA